MGADKGRFSCRGAMNRAQPIVIPAPGPSFPRTLESTPPLHMVERGPGGEARPTLH